MKRSAAALPLLWASLVGLQAPRIDGAEAAAQQPAELQAAIRELEAAARLNPSDAETHARLGIAYRKAGQPARAAESLERAVALDSNTRVRVLLGFSYADAGRYRDAVPHLEACFAAEPKDAVRAAIGQRLVECRLALGEDLEALAVVEKLRPIAPDDPNVLYLSSKVYLSLWNGAFQRMLAVAPGSYQVHLIQAEALEAQERFDEAAREYREVQKLAPQVGGIHYRLGRVLLRGGADAESERAALAEFRKELELNPGDARAHAAVGEIQLGRSALSEAARSFERAVEAQPGYVPARVGLAKVLIAEKSWSKALEHLDAAARLAPDEEAVAYNRMVVYRALGRTEDAKRAFDAFQRLKERKEQSRPPTSPR